MNKRAVIAVFFILLFVVSLAVVFLNPPSQVAEGYVNVSRSENYHFNQAINGTDSRYLINYGIVAIADTSKVTVTDRTEANLTWIPIEQETTNVQVTYDKANGELTVVAINLKLGDKVFAQAAFLIDPVLIFKGGEVPKTDVNPTTINWGDEKDIEIKVVPFTIQNTVNITEVGVYAWFTDVASEIKGVSTSPLAVSEAPTYQAIWRYKKPTSFNYTAHTATYHVKIRSIPTEGSVVLRTWIEARYSSPLRMATDGKIEGAKGYFFRVDSAISYQYEHPLGAKP